MKDGENQPSALTQSVCSTHVITHNVMMPCPLELVRDWEAPRYGLSCTTCLTMIRIFQGQHITNLGGLFDLECALHH